MKPSISLTREEQLAFFRYYETLKPKPVGQKELDLAVRWWFKNVKEK